MINLKKIAILSFFAAVLVSSNTQAETLRLDDYIFSFDRNEQRNMKVDSETLMKGVKAGTILLLDIRFREEIQENPLSFGKAIPLNELPARLKEIPGGKLIVTACPVKDRAIIAMVYLRTLGFKVKYLNDGLIGLNEYLQTNSTHKSK